ncbi:MAG: MOSC domain-containing protein [Pontibacterium sp.]
MITLQSLHTFPIKSTKGIRLDRSYVELAGLSFDRRFILAKDDGSFISARRTPQLLHFSTAVTAWGLQVIAPDGDTLDIRLPELFDNYRQVTVWGTEINGQHCSAEIDEWFSAKLKTECSLLYFGEQSERFTSRRPEAPVGFADGYPVLLISQASLDDLNQRAGQHFSMDQFRPNLVVSGCEPFAEDTWQRIRIGTVEFELVKPCSRCVMTTWHPDTLERYPKSEPLKTLASYRRKEDGEVYFGQNLVPCNTGTVEEGDEVLIIA